MHILRITIFFFLVLYSSQTLPAQNLEILEKIGDSLPSLPGYLYDENNQKINLLKYIKNNQSKPTILIPSYYTCSRICPYIMRDLAMALDQIKDLNPGQDYHLISVSINSNETSKDTLHLKKDILKNFQKKRIQNSDWLYLRGNQQQIDILMQGLGYPYRKDGDEFFHSAVIVFINHKLQINRYIYGSQYRTSEIRLSLIEASQLKLGKSIDRLKLYCFRYDPTTGKYTTRMKNIFKIGGLVTVLFIFIIIMLAIYWPRRSIKK